MRLPRSNMAIGLVALAVIARGRVLRLHEGDPAEPHYEVRAAFESSNNLRPGSPVRIAGVEVGKVTGVERAERGGTGAIVTMRIEDKGRPIHADATAKIRPRIFLEGNFFVDLTAGSPSAPELEDGGTLPVQQTATPVQLDEVLTALQSDTREDLKILLREYGKGLEGAGAKGFNGSIPYWEPAYRDSAIVNEAMLGETGHDLSGYVDKAGATAAALDRNRAQLKSLITDFNTTAGAFAREDANLQAAIAELPRTLRAALPGARRAQRGVPAAARAGDGPAAGRPELRPDARRGDPVRAPAARAASPRTSCAAWRPTCGRRCPTSPHWSSAACRCTARSGAPRAARTT